MVQSEVMNDIVITAAVRTPIGSLGGSLSSVSASDLGALVIASSLKRSSVDGGEVDEVLMGQVLTAACGQNPARQAALKAGISEDKTAVTVNQVCGSGLRAVAMASQSIRCGDSCCIVAGGQENMSQAPHAALLRQGKKMGDMSFTDTMIKDGIWCAMNDYHMGITAENVAEKWQVSRKEQDEFSLASQHKAEKAQKSGRFKDEIIAVPVTHRKETVEVSEDEFPRHGLTLEQLERLRPAFKKEGTVTAGNASGINDGAAALVVMSGERATRQKCQPLARIVSWASVGVSPALMGSGPITASREALKRANWSMDDLDLIEANEAFAAQACAVTKDLGWDENKINVNGGAIALGHPIGASGARILVTLIHELQKRGLSKGLATLCIGGGQGIAMCVEAL